MTDHHLIGSSQQQHRTWKFIKIQAKIYQVNITVLATLIYTLSFQFCLTFSVSQTLKISHKQENGLLDQDPFMTKLLNSDVSYIYYIFVAFV